MENQNQEKEKIEQDFQLHYQYHIYASSSLVVNFF